MNIDEYTPEDANRELMELLVKCSRRCAYDLSHCAGDVRDDRLSEYWHKRACQWTEVFDPACGLKDYRATLHLRITEIECVNRALIKLCEDHGIDVSAYKLPF